MSNGTLAPTSFWYCDSCGKKIERVEEGWVEWIAVSVPDELHRCRDLRLVHKDHFNPDKGYRCQFNQQAEFARDNGTVSDVPLRDFLGADGLTDLLELLERDGRFQRMEVLQLIMRLHVPGYEHAFRRYDDAVADGVIDPNAAPGFLMQSQISAILDRYGS